jgi:hypothetical protein
MRGFRGVRRQFHDAVAPRPGETIEGLRGTRMPKPDLTRWQRVEIDEGEDLDAALAELRAIPGIEVAEPDYLRKPTVLPGTTTDPLYGQQWHLAAANIPQAWAHLESLGLPPGGARDIVVAVIDTGVDMTHPDLAVNLWTDSATGLHGRDVVAEDDDPSDDHGHGTHVAGIIAAQANNATGGVGVAYNVQIMPIKAAQYSGELAASDIAEGITWAVQHGADIINMSFGGYGKSQIEEDALAVAFGSAVLVAAAGNDGLTNDWACNPLHWGAMYPAAYDWVLGVMASEPSGGRASFSNWDCIPRDAKEYEVLAPGANIWSTLPGAQYAAWSGTSMATPVVSGIAALLRTKFTDRNIFDSRFIMGQIVSTAQASVDAFSALTSAPAPELSFLDSYVFDPASLNVINNANGAVDASETIDLAVVIRNHWGKAENVSVRLEPLAAGAVGPDPYVTMVTDTVTYGAVGSFGEDDNGLTRDPDGMVTGVTAPFRFSLASSTPNGHRVPFLVTMTAYNGFDPTNTTPVVTQSRFELLVTNGRELPRIVSQDTNLTPDVLWVIAHPVLVEAGVTLRILPGTRVIFAFRPPASVYQQPEVPYLHVNGALDIQGTSTAPVELRSDPEVGSALGTPVGIRIRNFGTTRIQYARIGNPFLGYEHNTATPFSAPLTLLDHVVIDGPSADPRAYYGLAVQQISNSLARHLGYGPVFVNQLESSLFESVNRTSGWYSPTPLLYSNTAVVTDTVFSGESALHLQSGSGDVRLTRCSLLNRYALDPAEWMTVEVDNLQNCSGPGVMDQSGNYWGTTSTTLIDALIKDFYDNFSCPRVDYRPLLTPASPELATTYPFVLNVGLTGTGGPAFTFGAEPVTFTVTFNRDMDPTVQPQVSFGPDEPYTDHTVTGAWQDARTWVGTYAVNALTGDGYQYIRVAGARAASDPWLVTGDDQGRFRFEIVTSGSSAMNLQASGGEGYVDLGWTQNDFDLLAGFNLYRAIAADGTYVRVNPTLVPPQTRAFRDTSVAPGQPYYYKFVVVKTDMTESQPSNVATATPLDTVPPTITHAPRTSAPPGLAISLSAQVTDNVAVRGVSLHFRAIGETTYTTRPMTNAAGTSYSATIEGSAVASPGVEYYLSATDGVSTVNSGRPEYPYQVIVVDRPVVTAISPGIGPVSGGTAVTIAGTNFKPGATVTFGGAIASSVQVVSSSQLTCVTPTHFPAAVDVQVANPDGQAGALLRGFSFQSDTASLSLPNLTAGQHAIVQVPVNAAVLDGLVAADLRVTFDPTILAPRGGTTGTLTPGWSLATNTATAGQVSVSMASNGGPVAGSGVLANLEFELIGAPATSTVLALASARLNGGAIPASTADGSVQVEAVCEVSGMVTYWNGGLPIPGVDLQLSGDRLYAAHSGAGGGYTVIGAAPGAYLLRPSKTGDAGGISAFDASLVLQHAAGARTMVGPETIAGDVDKSGVIDSMDAFYILQRAANLIALPFPGAGVTWEFTPPTRTLSNLSDDLSGQDFVGVLLGDPSGSWAQQTASLASTSVGLRVTEWPPTAGGDLTATIALHPQGQPVFSIDLVLGYDVARGAPTSVSLDAGAAGWMMNANTSVPGEIRISMAGAAPITADAAVLVLAFETSGSSQDVGLVSSRIAVNENLPADVAYTLSVEHAQIAARMAVGLRTPSAAELPKYDQAPLVAGAPVPDGAVGIGDVLVILRNAQGLDP